MVKVEIQVPESLAEQLSAVRDRLPEVLAHGLDELSPIPNEVYRYILEFLASNPEPKTLMEFEPTPEMQARVQELLEKDRDGRLTLAESAELDEYMRINHLVTMLKARALSFLSPQQ